MPTIRPDKFRALVGVVVLCLAMLAGVATMPEPTAARTNLEWLCDATGARSSTISTNDAMASTSTRGASSTAEPSAYAPKDRADTFTPVPSDPD